MQATQSSNPVLSFGSFPEATQYIKKACEGKNNETITFSVDLFGECVVKYKLKNDPNFNSVERLRQMKPGDSSPYQGKITLLKLAKSVSNGDMNFGMNIIKRFREQLKAQGLPVDMLKDKSNGFDHVEATRGYNVVPRQQPRQRPAQQPAYAPPPPVDPNQPVYSFLAAGAYTTIDSNGQVTSEQNVRKVIPHNEAARRALEEKRS